MLHAALPVAHRLGIDPALVTCDLDNIASQRVIERNGGVLEDQRGDIPVLTAYPPCVGRRAMIAAREPCAVD